MMMMTLADIVLSWGLGETLVVWRDTLLHYILSVRLAVRSRRPVSLRRHKTFISI